MKRLCIQDGKDCVPDYATAKRTAITRLNSKKEFVATSQVKWSGECRKCHRFMEWMVGKNETPEKPAEKGKPK